MYSLYLISPSDVDPQHAKKCNTIVKGFKVLEANYQESERKRVFAEERLSTIEAAHTHWGQGVTYPTGTL